MGAGTLVNHTGEQVAFREVQLFRKTWVLALVLPISVFLIILFGYGMIKHW